MKKIALLNCFFGEFPWYFSFFIKSCADNSSVDFIIFSDNYYGSELPENVTIIPFTMDDFNKLASIKLGVDIEVRTPYKLCDFKPAYGIIFSDYLLSYDFWGMCDLDIVLGRIREFITPEILNDYDIISTRHDYVTGWFMLFKNNSIINNLFMKSKDYIKVFTSNTHYCFDECNFKHSQLSDDISIFDIPCEIESMEHIIQREVKQNNITVFYDLIMADGLCGKLMWKEGTLIYDRKFEVLLYHLIRYKSNEYSIKPLWKDIPDLFYIDKYIFRKKTASSVVNFFRYFYSNKIKVLSFKIMHFAEYFSSIFFISKTSAAFPNGIYKNCQGDTFIWANKNCLSFNDYSNGSKKIIPSRFRENIFFLKSNPLVKFSYYMDAKRSNSSKIQLTQIDGSIINYQYNTEIKNDK